MQLIKKFQSPFGPITLAPRQYNTNYVEIIPQPPESYEHAIQQADERAKIARRNHIMETMDRNQGKFIDGRNEGIRMATTEDIPVTKDNYILINNPQSKKTHLRVIPKAILDSLAYHHGQNPNIDMEVVYGLPERESGYHGYSLMNLKDTDHFEVDPYFLMSTWNYDVSPETNMFIYALNHTKDADKARELVINNYNRDIKKYQNDELYNPNMNIYDWAWEWFKRGKYNPGDPDYENKVRFKKWWNDEGKQYYEKGKLIPRNYWGSKIQSRKAECIDCAKYANGRVEEGEGDYSTWGNAWNLKNVDLVFSGYNQDDRPKEFDYDAVDKYNRAASDRVWTDFDSKTLDPDRPYMVNMYYKGSPYLETAYKEGKGVTGTHTGVLENINGKWYVTHNIHGKIFQEPFLNLQGGNKNWGVTAIYSPRTKSLINRFKTMLGF